MGGGPIRGNWIHRIKITGWEHSGKEKRKEEAGKYSKVREEDITAERQRVT
jgi:hypothetical protein